ncbi:hypothetical protein GY45DRAFT_1102292 [Cubamyces sp. BRFM 1775]|nr:hypothetical protein GY45DRAFT_1102292 [Cubamyces sp. BRFM 1775]
MSGARTSSKHRGTAFDGKHEPELFGCVYPPFPPRCGIQREPGRVPSDPIPYETLASTEQSDPPRTRADSLSIVPPVSGIVVDGFGPVSTQILEVQKIRKARRPATFPNAALPRAGQRDTDLCLSRTAHG